MFLYYGSKRSALAAFSFVGCRRAICLPCGHHGEFKLDLVLGNVHFVFSKLRVTQVGTGNDESSHLVDRRGAIAILSKLLGRC